MKKDEIKEIFLEALEASGTKPYWKYLWWAWIATCLLILIENLYK